MEFPDAGPSTTVDTIFELKEQGILRGAKRRLRFTEDLEVGSNIKCPKVSEGRNTSENTDKTDRKKDYYEHTRINRSEVRVNISKCAGGWHGGKKTPLKISKSQGLKVGKAQEKISTPK